MTALRYRSSPSSCLQRLGRCPSLGFSDYSLLCLAAYVDRTCIETIRQHSELVTLRCRHLPGTLSLAWSWKTRCPDNRSSPMHGLQVSRFEVLESCACWICYCKQAGLAGNKLSYYRFHSAEQVHGLRPRFLSCTLPRQGLGTVILLKPLLAGFFGSPA